MFLQLSNTNFWAVLLIGCFFLIGCENDIRAIKELDAKKLGVEEAKKVKVNYEQASSKRKNTGYFIKGFLMCIFNPAILLYWLSVTSSVISISGEIKSSEIIPFFGSILITQFSLDVLKAYYANKLRYKIKEKNIAQLNRVAGVLILIFAVRLIYNLLTGHSLI